MGRRAGDFAGWLIFGMRPVPLGVLTATLSAGQTEERLICNLSPATSCIEGWRVGVAEAGAVGATDVNGCGHSGVSRSDRCRALRGIGHRSSAIAAPVPAPPSGKPARSSVIKLFEPDIQTA
jgi:hypothetical protein